MWHVRLARHPGTGDVLHDRGRAMRLIHTSDWHLGRTLHGESLLEHQAVFLDWLLDRGGQSQQADAVVVAGDIYDRAVPSTRRGDSCSTRLCVGFARPASRSC